MADAPDFLTVEETARVLRIRRTAAYQLANHDLATGGSDGLRARRFGKLIRVPRSALEELTGGPMAWPPATTGRANPAKPDAVMRSSGPSTGVSRPTPKRQRVTDDTQLRLIGND